MTRTMAARLLRASSLPILPTLAGLRHPALSFSASAGPPPRLGDLLRFPGIAGSAPILPSDFFPTLHPKGASPAAPTKRKAVLLCNTASECGFTPQLAGLEALYRRLGPDHFSVVAVPCNDFGAQEPAEEKDVLAFYRSKYCVTFPVASKTLILGKDAHPAYKWIQQHLGEAGSPQWNFAKYLITADGELAGLFAPSVAPEEDALVSAVEVEVSAARSKVVV